MAGEHFRDFRGAKSIWGRTRAKKRCHHICGHAGFKKLDAVALTHAHQDHIGGLTAVLQNFHVARVVAGEGNGGACVCAIEGRWRRGCMCLWITNCADNILCGTECRWIFFGRRFRRKRLRRWQKIMIRW